MRRKRPHRGSLFFCTRARGDVEVFGVARRCEPLSSSQWCVLQRQNLAVLLRDRWMTLNLLFVSDFASN
jgi:hypothetical protein